MQNEPDDDLEGLPPSVRRYSYEGKDQFSRILALERERLLDSMRNSREMTNIDTASGSAKTEPNIETTEHIIFSIDPTTFQQDFVGPDIIPIHSIRTSFNPKTELLIVKMVTGEHTEIAFAVHKAIDKALGRMGLDEAIHNYHCVDIDVNGQMKQVDMGWGPRRPPHGCPKRPTVILEVAVSETQRKLDRDVNLWLDPVRGNANIAMAIKINRERPMISIDKWVWGHDNGTSLKSQHIEVSESEIDRVKISGGPLIITFHLFFLRSPQTPRETNVIIDNEWLRKIAEWGWDMQFQ
ncbi:uncharacterized protein N7479_011229 [Penicillium vulpinum]|uniref:uncharacterized protein n=1 Tax=Penicillium vulpinum TaxID=29845 RepID=UPI002547F166|nr:uncharacterized protein N7479_011229 [Penicillium vulpinum]KAJ5952816.1 hypothetical protein N7479_011229 [Penicillium vulpinum]